jgi:hypothetical protein
MMTGVSLETCWVIKKQWNNKFYYTVAPCWLFLYDLHLCVLYSSLDKEQLFICTALSDLIFITEAECIWRSEYLSRIQIHISVRRDISICKHTTWLNHFFEAFYMTDNDHHRIRTKNERITFNDCSIGKSRWFYLPLWVCFCIYILIHTQVHLCVYIYAFCLIHTDISYTHGDR